MIQSTLFYLLGWGEFDFDHGEVSRKRQLDEAILYTRVGLLSFLFSSCFLCVYAPAWCCSLHLHGVVLCSCIAPFSWNINHPRTLFLKDNSGAYGMEPWMLTFTTRGYGKLSRNISTTIWTTEYDHLLLFFFC